MNTKAATPPLDTNIASQHRHASAVVARTKKLPMADQVATVPSGIATNRHLLIGVLTFMEAASSWRMTTDDLAAWFEEFLVRPGYMGRPARVYEHGTGNVFLEGLTTRPRQELLLREVLQVSRKEITALLEGFVEIPHDDRFLTYFVATGRVRLIQKNGQSIWQPKPRVTDRLSDIILAMLTADMLADRRLYEERLMVCAECGRLSFRLEHLHSQRCPRHGAAVLENLARVI